MKKIRLGILFSGGKDSCLALDNVLETGEVKCLITILSENSESFMFHTPNIALAEKQAEAIGLPIIIHKTKGIKEEELKDLEEAIQEAKKKYALQGIVTGAVASNYQASRIKKICDKLDLECINPLWGKDQVEELEEIVKEKFEVIIVGVFALGMDKFLGKGIDKDFIQNIKKVQDKYGINPAGEGGEFESFVLDAPFFKKSINIKKSHAIGREDSRILKIDEIELEDKKIEK